MRIVCGSAYFVTITALDEVDPAWGTFDREFIVIPPLRGSVASYAHTDLNHLLTIQVTNLFGRRLRMPSQTRTRFVKTRRQIRTRTIFGQLRLRDCCDSRARWSTMLVSSAIASASPFGGWHSITLPTPPLLVRKSTRIRQQR